MEDNNQQTDQQVTDPSANSGDNPPAAPPTPPSNQQTGGDPSILAAYQQQLLHEARERARLQRELDAVRAIPPKPPSPEEEKEFFDKPKSVVRELVRQEIQEAVRPFNQSAAQQQRIMLIEEIKKQMRKNVAQFPYIDQVESLFDQIISNTQVIDANVAVAAYNTALGYHISQGGRLEAKQSDTPTTPNRGNAPVNPNPPHIRPSAPPPPPASGQRKIRALTENERRIARYNNQTDEEYLVWSGEMDPKDVVNITDDDIKARAK